MALTERGRAVLHRTLGPIIGDEEVAAEMVSHLAVDTASLATKDSVHAQLAVTEANLRAEIQAATKAKLMWYIGISTTQLGIVVGLVLSLR